MNQVAEKNYLAEKIGGMSSKVSISRQSSPLPDRWKGYANEDTLIDAWLDGKEAGRKEGIKKMTETFHKNLETALQLSEDLYAYIVDELGARCVINRVKPENFDVFESLFAVEKEKYIDKEFRRTVYEKSRELSAKGAENSVSMDFIITSAIPEMNRTALITNGYWYEFRPKPINGN